MSQSRPYISAVILSGGIGSRIGGDKTKQKIEICGKTILRRTLEVFDNVGCIDEIVLVFREGEEDFAKVSVRGLSKPTTLVTGGSSRAQSARCGFLAVSDKSSFVMIHDGARCLITEEEIEQVANAAVIHGAASAVLAVTDTVKRISFGKISETVPRDELVFAATPQAFSKELYERGLSECEPSAEVTDDNMLIEKIGISIVPVYTSKDNIKITTKEDIELAEFILSKRGLI